jgi:hypothetical protein
VLPGSSPLTGPFPLHKHTRSKGPSLPRCYPASLVPLALSDAQMVRRPFWRRSRFAAPRPPRASPTDARLPFWHAVLTTPVDRFGAWWLLQWRAPAPGSSRFVPPSPVLRRVGVHIAAFEACSSFTRVTACQIARPPYVDFVAGFRPAPFPGLAARQLSNPTINCSSGSFPHW